MNFKNISLIITCLFVFQQSIAQRNFDEYNKFGISGGYTITNIDTDDLPLDSGNGFTFGLETRGSFRNNFDLIYGVSFFGSNFTIDGYSGLESSSQVEKIEFSQQSVQLKFLLSYNIVKHHLSIEFGPAVAIQGKLKPTNNNFEDYFINGYATLQAKDLRDVSVFDFRLAGGITAGFEPFRISVLYLRGITNSLQKLNNENLENRDFSGNSDILAIRGTVYF